MLYFEILSGGHRGKGSNASNSHKGDFICCEEELDVINGKTKYRRLTEQSEIDRIKEKLTPIDTAPKNAKLQPVIVEDNAVHPTDSGKRSSKKVELATEKKKIEVETPALTEKTVAEVEEETSAEKEESGETEGLGKDVSNAFKVTLKGHDNLRVLKNKSGEYSLVNIKHPDKPLNGKTFKDKTSLKAYIKKSVLK